MWATDHINGALTQFDLPRVRDELSRKSHQWIDVVIRHATDHGAFFLKIQ